MNLFQLIFISASWWYVWCILFVVGAVVNKLYFVSWWMVGLNTMLFIVALITTLIRFSYTGPQ